MVEHLHKEKRSGIFRYRRRVPPELQGVLGKKAFDFSLKTKNPDQPTLRTALEAFHGVVLSK